MGVEILFKAVLKVNLALLELDLWDGQGREEKDVTPRDTGGPTRRNSE